MHLDVKTAFLNGILKENVYMYQPEGIISQEHGNKVFKIRKAVSGLKQSSHACNERVDEVLTNLNY